MKRDGDFIEEGARDDGVRLAAILSVDRRLASRSVGGENKRGACHAAVSSGYAPIFSWTSSRVGSSRPVMDCRGASRCTMRW